MPDARMIKVWCLLRDQCADVDPVRDAMAGTAEFVYDAEWQSERMLTECPDVVLCVNDFQPMIAHCVSAAHAAGIPSVVLQDGILEWRCQYENPLFGSGGGAPQHQPVLASKIACIGAQSARQIAAWGNQGKIEVTGMPRLDALRSMRRDRREVSRKTLLVMTAKKPGSTKEQVAVTLDSLRAVQQALAGHPEWQVIWRITKSLHETLGVRNDLQELSAQDLSRVLQQVDPVVSTPSTAMLEAMLMDLPVACVDFHNMPRFVPTVWTISAPSHIEPTLQELASPHPRKMRFQRDMLEDVLYLSEPAAPRTARLLEAMAEARRRAAESAAKLRLPYRILSCPDGSRSTDSLPLAELYPDQPMFQQDDVRTLQSTVARLQKENELLRSHLQTRSAGYWLQSAGRWLSRRLRANPRASA